jgi:putative ABC transport system substrate-binding protein
MKKAAERLILCAGVLLAVAIVSEAQQAKKVYRIGYITNRTEMGPNEEAFRRGLRELGYIEGENLVIEWRFTGAQLDRNPAVAAELVRLKVDCIVTAGLGLSRAAKQSTSTIPIVMANVSDDPVRNKLIDSLARPGGNITGFTDIAHDLAGKRLELVKETLPKVSRGRSLVFRLTRRGQTVSGNGNRCPSSGDAYPISGGAKFRGFGLCISDG